MWRNHEKKVVKHSPFPVRSQSQFPVRSAEAYRLLRIKYYLYKAFED